MAVDGNHVYWANSQLFNLSPGSIGRANLDGTLPDGDFIPVPHPGGVAVDAGGGACAGGEATIVGTAGPDELRGTDGDDVIAALGGDDTVTGLKGDDVVCGSGGDDVIRGKGGNDDLRAGRWR